MLKYKQAEMFTGSKLRRIILQALSCKTVLEGFESFTD